MGRFPPLALISSLLFVAVFSAFADGGPPVVERVLVQEKFIPIPKEYPYHRLPPAWAEREFVGGFPIGKIYRPRRELFCLPPPLMAAERRYLYLPPELVEGGGGIIVLPPERLRADYAWRFIPDETAARLGDERFYIVSFDYQDAAAPKTLQEIIDLDDPIEGFNRTMFSFNNILFVWVFRPVGTVWASVFPREVINHFSNMTDNLEVMVRVGSCVLQGRFEDAGVEFGRFMINTTAGVAGLFDPAGHFWGIQKRDEDFGQAFASWGCGPGFYLVFPLHGPTTLRDGVGLIFDYGLDIKFYIPYANYFTLVNSGTKNWHDYKRTMEQSADPYELVKTVWNIMRRAKINDQELRK
jgi:phospholipid-binding lipoprotein MlaA